MQGDDAHEKRKRSFRRFQYRGVDLEQLLELSLDDLLDLFHARARRKCAPQHCESVLGHSLPQPQPEQSAAQAGRSTCYSQSLCAATAPIRLKQLAW